MSVASTAWMDRGSCRTGENRHLFFGAEAEAWHEKAAREEQAKQVCARCPVAVPCRDWAITTDDNWGVAGAMTPEERKAA